jgi:hypothetical protein
MFPRAFPLGTEEITAVPVAAPGQAVIGLRHDRIAGFRTSRFVTVRVTTGWPAGAVGTVLA